MSARTAEIRQLQAFSVLAEELHFGRAATRLGVTQSALSQLMKDLELRVGTPLLERTTRRVGLTPAGTAFLADAQDIIARLQRSVMRARDIAGVTTQTLRIGAGISTTFSILPRLLRRFQARYPHVVAEVEVLQSPEIVRAIEHGRLDVGLLRPPAEVGRLHIETLAKEGFLAAMPEDHPLTRTTVRLADLAGEKLLRLSRPDLRGVFEDADRQMADAGIDLAESRIVHSTVTALALISATGRICLVPEWAGSAAWPGITFRAVEGLTATTDLGIAWEANRRNPAVLNFFEAAKQMASLRRALN